MNKEQKAFHKSRRKEFSKLIGNDSIAIIFGSTHHNKSFDGDHNFKQYKNFYYLTGFTEANSALVLMPSGSRGVPLQKGKRITEVLYVQKKDPLMETWNGKRLGCKNVKDELGIEEGKENSELESLLNGKILSAYRYLYINFSELIKLNGEMKHITSGFLDKLNVIAPNVEIIDASYLLGRMRAVKTKYEIKVLKQSADITVRSCNETLTMIKPGLNEHQVQANLEYHYKYNGAQETAYYPIVAGGDNACILHYDKNDQVLKNGELLLIDSGAEYNYYCTDITRTFPINGKFTEEQKLIYEIVLKANKECIRKIKPGIKFSELTVLSERILADGLYKAGILKNKKDIKTYSLHGLGHHIGLDTHDAVDYRRKLKEDNDVLREGNVLTIEPGLYFPKGSKGIDRKFWGTGVRIEDDVLVIKNGYENLTNAMVKEVSSIEFIMNVG
ncbi:MAG: aminopeptidase P family protein [Ignavibacteria bacterium]|nr:aminopeptidase P family protein [Ignavibacteria bacterium]